MRRVLIVALLAAAVVGKAAPAQQVQVSPANRTVAVTISDTAERRADVGTLHIGFQLYAPDSATVYAQAAQTSQAIAQALAHAGVSPEAIASVNQGTGPTQDFGNRELTPAERAERKFQANQSWTVKTSPDRVPAILAAAVQAGANESGNVEWSLAEEGELSREAAAKALAHAKAIATEMAGNLGASLGKLLYASNEAEPIRPRIMLEARAGVVEAGQLAQLKVMSLSAPMITRSATISAIFALE